MLINLFLNRLVQKEPGALIGTIAKVLGSIMDVIFNFVSNFTTTNTLGITIIIFTLLARLLMIPFSINTYKSSAKMREIQPEMDKIKKKYSGKDPESQQKLNSEIQTLYAKKGVNPLSGCLPMFIQMPIFFALTSVMNNSYKYIGALHDVYVTKISETISSSQELLAAIIPIANTKIPPNGSIEVAIEIPEQLARIIYLFKEEDWSAFVSAIPDSLSSTGVELLGYANQVVGMQNFLGLRLTDGAGLTAPGIILAVLTGATSFIQQYIMMKQQEKSSSGGNDTMMATQKNMLIMMPLMMAFFTITTPVGVGLYWITGNLVMILQQIILNKLYSRKKEMD